jgi:hypothetical protein
VLDQPKIRKAKSQSFRTRKNSGHKNMGSSMNFGANTPWTEKDGKKRSPVHQIKSPGSVSQQEGKSVGQKPGISRQGTIRASHRRQNSISTSTTLNLNQGLRSPSSMYNDRSPLGRRSPNLLPHDQLRSPLSAGHHFDRKSPTSISGRRSPIMHSQGTDSMASDRKSSVTSSSSFAYDRKMSMSTIQVQSGRSSYGLSHGLITAISISQDKKSPAGTSQSGMYIPPITISNPSETFALIQKSVESKADHEDANNRPPRTPDKTDSPPTTEKKEKPSVMSEILAFVRKPSKKVMSRTSTSRFAAAFSRRESDSGSPLVRQSTFSSIPNTSSMAGRSAVTKQMSEVAPEPKISSRLKNVGSKMSLRLRRQPDTKKKEKKSSGEDVSDVESTDGKSEKPEPGDSTFDVDVHFQKVGDSYIKHDQITEEESPTKGVVPTVAVNGQNGVPQGRKTSLYEELKKIVETIVDKKETVVEVAKEVEVEVQVLKPTIQCPTFEIEPPSRRASFDPPRSPFLENLRSFSDTDHEGTTTTSRFDSGGESFEIVDTDRYRDSSFEDRHSSMDTSFDISKYQSTSYEDQNSSFEVVEPDRAKSSEENKSVVELRKSSIELVDADTFQKQRADGRKSSLETHFDLADNYKLRKSRSPLIPKGKKPISEPGRPKELTASATLKTHYSAPHHRPRSPLSNQTSSNYSSRDSYDSVDPYSDPNRQHFPLLPSRRSSNEYQTTGKFLCTDKRCASIFEPRPQRYGSTLLSAQDTSSSGNEFDLPSPERRAASASPKHTFTFRIVLKKVESSPDAIYPSKERRPSRDHRRRDSRKKKLLEIGKSF